MQVGQQPNKLADVTVIEVPEQQVAVIRALLHQPAEVLEAVIEALGDSTEPSPLDPALWGRASSGAEIAKAATWAAVRATELRTRAVEDLSVETAGMARWLGMTPQAVLKAREANRLVAFRHGREWRFPTWQIDQASMEPNPRTADLAKAFSGGIVALTIWMHTDNTVLGAEPWRLFRDHPDHVIAAARSGS